MKKKCCICGKEFSEFPNNANPIKDSCCCDECNSKFVYHARYIIHHMTVIINLVKYH